MVPVALLTRYSITYFFGMNQIHPQNTIMIGTLPYQPCRYSIHLLLWWELTSLSKYDNDRTLPDHIVVIFVVSYIGLPSVVLKE